MRAEERCDKDQGACNFHNQQLSGPWSWVVGIDKRRVVGVHAGVWPVGFLLCSDWACCCGVELGVVCVCVGSFLSVAPLLLVGGTGFVAQCCCPCVNPVQ